MHLDTGQAVVILAVLVFYLRLIILQRQRVKQVRLEQIARQANKAKKGHSVASPVSPARFSVLSSNPRDRVIGGLGAGLILLGVLYFGKVLPPVALQNYWWILTSGGIVAFSWLFRL